MILGIETSCDECSAAIVQETSGGGLQVLGLSTDSQVQLHQPYGGVVPEVASRNHLETVQSMIDRTCQLAGLTHPKLWYQLKAIAVTYRPGLIGSLLVGVSAAKALAYALKKPLVPVHHLEGHIASLFLLDHEASKTISFKFPLLVALVSGGHTQLYLLNHPPEHWPIDFLKTACLGRSRDDAAGEAFDKIAKMLGLGYPGGAIIEKMAQQGDAHAFELPRALQQKDHFDFSFSGLKTAALLLIQKLKKQQLLQTRLEDLCASVQAAIFDALLSKIKLAVQTYQCQSLAVVGGVAANQHLRYRLQQHAASWGLEQVPVFPSLQYCTDNAAMIAAAGYFRWKQGHFLTDDSLLRLSASASSESSK